MEKQAACAANIQRVFTKEAHFNDFLVFDSPPSTRENKFTFMYIFIYLNVYVDVYQSISSVPAEKTSAKGTKKYVL